MVVGAGASLPGGVVVRGRDVAEPSRGSHIGSGHGYGAAGVSSQTTCRVLLAVTPSRVRAGRDRRVHTDHADSTASQGRRLPYWTTGHNPCAFGVADAVVHVESFQR